MSHVIVASDPCILYDNSGAERLGKSLITINVFSISTYPAIMRESTKARLKFYNKHLACPSEL